MSDEQGIGLPITRDLKPSGRIGRNRRQPFALLLRPAKRTEFGIREVSRWWRRTKDALDEL